MPLTPGKQKPSRPNVFYLPDGVRVLKDTEKKARLQRPPQYPKSSYQVSQKARSNY
jgi:hypothetical protein